MSDPNATHRISRAELFSDDEDTTAETTQQISREDLFRDERPADQDGSSDAR